MPISIYTRLLLLCIAVCGVFALAALVPFGAPAEALSTSWTGELGSRKTNFGNRTRAVTRMRATVEYNTKVHNRNSGETYGKNIIVTEGDELTFVFEEHKKQDISYFATGSGYGSPYGIWRNGARYDSQVYKGGGISGNRGNRQITARYYVDPPSKRIMGLGALGSDCHETGNDSLNCTMNKPGTYTVRMHFNKTAGRFWIVVTGRAWSSNPKHYGPRARRLDVPAQDITYEVVVKPKSADNTNPNSPSLSLSGDGTCVVGEPTSISMSATDPDNDRVRFEIDWNPDSAADQITEWKNSGETVIASRTYATEGEKSVRVRTQDEQGTYSGWQTVAFTCTASAEDDDDSDNSGETSGIILGSSSGGEATSPADLVLSAIPSLVQRGDTSQINWQATNVDSCTVTGDNADSWSGLASPVGGETSSAITGRVVYTLACIDLQGEPQTDTATVNVVPVFQEI